MEGGALLGANIGARVSVDGLPDDAMVSAVRDVDKWCKLSDALFFNFVWADPKASKAFKEQLTAGIAGVRRRLHEEGLRMQRESEWLEAELEREYAALRGAVPEDRPRFH